LAGLKFYDAGVVPAGGISMREKTGEINSPQHQGAAGGMALHVGDGQTDKEK